MTASQPTTAGGEGPTLRRAGIAPAAVGAEQYAPCEHCGGTGITPRKLVPALPVAPLAEAPPVVTDVERAAVARLVAIICEVLDLRRPVAQLPAAAPAVRYLRAARPTRPRVNGATRVLSVRASRPTRDGIEVVAVLQVDGRPRALAARLDGPAGAWTMTAVRIL